MKKNNKKGFTLIELLAVIVILITISAIAIPSITASIERSKAKQKDAKIEIIVEAAKLYYSEHKNVLNTQRFMQSGCYIPLSVLGLTEKELENPQTGSSFEGGVFYYNSKYVVDQTNLPMCKENL